MKLARDGSAHDERNTLFVIGLETLPAFSSFKKRVYAHMVMRAIEQLARERKARTTPSIWKYLQSSVAPSMTHAAVSQAVESLIDEEYLLKSQTNELAQYELTEGAKDSLTASADTFDRNFSQITADLFGRVETPDKQWKQAFFAFLCRFFADMGREALELVTGTSRQRPITGAGAIESHAQSAAKEYPAVKSDTLAGMAKRFFSETTPEGTAVKWIMAQSYFAQQAVGMGPALDIISASFLSRKRIFLDTNVLFPLAIDKMARYEVLQEFEELCKTSGAQLAVGKVTIDELRASVAWQLDAARESASSVPEELYESMAEPVFMAIRSVRELDPERPLERILDDFSRIADHVLEEHRVTLVDDAWFDQAGKTKDVYRLAKRIRAESRRRRSKDSWKEWPVALHDAIMLTYVGLERQKGRDALFLTLDSTLPALDIPANPAKARIAMTLDSLLQWLGPSIAASRVPGLANAYAKALRERFLPTERLFSLQDFKILDNLGIKCSELPAEDAHSCLERLKEILPAIDVSTPGGKLELQAEMQVFLVDDSRVIHQRIERLETERDAAQIRYQRLLRGVVATAVIALLGIGCFVAYSHGSGDSIWSRISNTWLFLSSTALIPLGLAWFVSRGHNRSR